MSSRQAKGAGAYKESRLMLRGATGAFLIAVPFALTGNITAATTFNLLSAGTGVFVLLRIYAIAERSSPGGFRVKTWLATLLLLLLFSFPFLSLSALSLAILWFPHFLTPENARQLYQAFILNPTPYAVLWIISGALTKQLGGALKRFYGVAHNFGVHWLIFPLSMFTFFTGAAACPLHSPYDNPTVDCILMSVCCFVLVSMLSVLMDDTKKLIDHDSSHTPAAQGSQTKTLLEPNLSNTQEHPQSTTLLIEQAGKNGEQVIEINAELETETLKMSSEIQQLHE